MVGDVLEILPLHRSGEEGEGGDIATLSAGTTR